MALHAPPVGLRRSFPSLVRQQTNPRNTTDSYALQSSFLSPSVQLLVSPPQQSRVKPATQLKVVARVASKQAYICRDCGYIYNERTPFEKFPDKYFCPAPARGASQDDFESIDLRTSSGDVTRRRNILFLLGAASISAFKHSFDSGSALAAEYADLPALRGKDYGKTKMRYPDYTETQSGLQYKDLRVGTGSPPKIGETVVVDWDGYTIGYYGRIFEARNKTKGGSFEGGDKDFFKFTLGYGQVIPAFEEAVAGMAPGGVRRIIVPPELGYPDTDFSKLGPRPTTFSGQRALAFVLDNQGLIDKTLLFDIELLKVIPAN